ncbi:nascent polypeptide-associated complex domain protein [Cooperia oncophora]
MVPGSLVSQHDDLEDGEIEEEECVVDLTEEDLSLTLRSQVEAEVIDLTMEKVEKGLEDSGGDVVCLEDLTLIDEEEITIIEVEEVTNLS